MFNRFEGTMNRITALDIAFDVLDRATEDTNDTTNEQAIEKYRHTNYDLSNARDTVWNMLQLEQP
jgi:hypothetical protein